MESLAAILPTFLALARHVALIVLTPAGVVIAATEAAERILGGRAMELVGRAWADACSDPPEITRRYLNECANSRASIDGAFHRMIEGVELTFACDGYAAIASDGERAVVLQIRPPLSEPRKRAPTASEPGLRVLIVDDNQDAAEMLSESLLAMGYVTRVAYDGAGALAIATGFDPQLALLDIGLPEMDGYELARRLRGEPGLDRIRLVAITGYGQDSDRARAREAGFDAHLVKPATVEHLDSLIRTLTAGARAAAPR